MASATLWVYACGDGTTEPPAPDPLLPTTVTVSPATATVVEGDTLRLTATATNVYGQVVAGVEFVWASGNTAVAVVDSTGLVTGVGAGQAEVMATAAGLTGRAELAVVAPLPTTVAVMPDTVVLTAVGQTAQLTAEVRDQAGRVMDGVPVAWLSAETTVAAVDASGLVTAVGGGAVTVTARAGEASGDALVTVAIDLDRVALVALYNATDGPNWVDNTNWLTDAPLGDWYGVSTNGAGRVVRIDLTGPWDTDGPNWVDNTNWLTDAPLGEWYGVSTNGAGRVVRIDLTGPWDNEAQRSIPHGLRGELPAELANLTELTSLRLMNNDLSGAIPPELGNLAKLRELRLDQNELAGVIPPELGGLSNLEWLSLGWNALSGAIPPELGNLAKLRELRLDQSELAGAIPPELGGLSNLEWLSIGSNALSGAVPPELGNLAKLEVLSLGSNALAGAIPPELGNLAKLESLGLLGDFWGPIPPELGNLVNLRGLALGGSLTGSIPPELGDLSNLEHLSLIGNHFSGPIPPELGELANLQILSLVTNQLTGSIPPELGNLTKLEWLNLWRNDLTGPVPPEFGNLVNLRHLGLGQNRLTGAIPQTLLNLPELESLDWSCGLRGVCVPGTSDFVAWVKRMEDTNWGSGPYCNASDQPVLTRLYEVAAGVEWTESGGWLGGPALEEWHGVETDSLGRVTVLDLSDNGLSGVLPGGIASLGHLTSLRIEGNELEGRLPLALTALDLDTFHYDGTDLCEPADAGFRTWLDGIPSRRGTGVQCAPLTDRDALVALYESTGGPGWTNRNGWLTEAPLRRWSGVEVDAQGRVVGLDLAWADLSGAIPPELGGLSNLGYLHLGGNDLAGAIPPELGNLANLESLHLYSNALSGAIPLELGDLANLKSLHLYSNALSGAIPPELGDLANLERMHLGYNGLSGAIPPELGGLSNLWSLSLDGNGLSGAIPPELGGLSNLASLHLGGNDLAGAIPPELGDLADLERMLLGQNSLSGPIPPTFGGLASLTELELSHNAGLAGAMPAGLRNLALESLVASGTELCVPREPAFEEWLATIPRRRIAVCGEPPVAYLVQAVQSRAHPVPLVAGEDALLRVFVTAAMETTEGITEVRARFYLNGTERHMADIPGSSTPIPTEIDEGDLATSANAEIPGRIVRPGLEMVVEIDPDGVLDASLGVPKRIPQEGRLAIEVREMPVLDLTVIPFLWNSDPDSAIIGLVEDMAADPEGHALLEDTHVLLPVAGLDVTARAPVASTSNNIYDLLPQTEAIRVLEGGGGHYIGMMSGDVTGSIRGIADLGGRSIFSVPRSGVIAHELGHNMGLRHAPCGAVSILDPSFPYPDGTIGGWGYDFRRGRLVPAARWDHMSYCDPTWTSDYHFTNALSHRLDDEGASAAALAAATVRSLLLWGGVDTTGTPFLNPAFVADAPPALPDSAGDYTVTGRDASGRELFSFSFPMPVALSEEAEVSSFVFALPAQPGWSDALASVTLSGPAGTATLDGDSDIPMAILRDPRTGQVRGILRDPPAANEAAADAVGGRAPGLEVLFSRGIPRGAAWRR